tara:strand:- start:93 stop:1130 length:1038 start_codon:yes stop_codon:yes gene_type:complete
MAYTTIDNPELYFQTKLYTGNSSTQSITFDGSENMQPDWVWSKARSQSDNSAIFDSVRGGQKQLRSNTGDAELTRTNAISSFDSDGFTMGSQAELNSNSVTYVAWNWKAGGSTSSNSDGDITTTVSVNQTAGFSIMKYAGNSTNSTIGHGLGASPEFIIFKEIDGGESWRVHSTHLPNNSSNTLSLNSNSAAFSQSNWISAISSSTISIGTDSSFNTSGNNYIAYTFAPKQGYSKFGSYTGNGNSDGTFVYTGFRPSFILYKNTMTADSWFLHDNKRQGFNDDNELMFGDATQGESTVNRIRILSNGFKAIDSDKGVNKSGDLYIYWAIAESPFVNSNGVPTNAR